MALFGYKYVIPVSEGGTGDASGTALITFNIIPLFFDSRRMVEFTFQAPADSGATRAQTFNFFGTADPRALHDLIHGTSTAQWGPALTIPAGSYHLSSTGFTVSGTDLELAAAAGTASLLFENPPAYMQVRMAAGGTASTGAGATEDDYSIWVEGR